LLATLLTGFAAHWLLGLPLLVALVFGAITAATDPISVLSIFKEMAVPKRLSIVVEGESLFNDGTAAVLFSILVAGVGSGSLGIQIGVRDFVVDVLGGVAVGLTLGYVFSKFTQKIDDPAIEITLTTVLAYSSYLAAQSLHLSGVIATVAAALTVGNFGAKSMSPRTRIALWSFWEYLSFIVNSLVFLLIGLQVRVGTLLRDWRATLLAIATVVLGRALSVYGLVPINNVRGRRIPLSWQHILVAGGIRGALALALALSLSRTFPHRERILAMTFGVVSFTIIFQGSAIKPLLRFLGVSSSIREDAYELARVHQIAVSSARIELDQLLRSHLLSGPAYDQLRQEVDRQLERAEKQVAELYGKDTTRVFPEIQMARMKLIAAEKSAIEQAVHDGLVSQQTAKRMIEDVDKKLDTLQAQGE
jgi:monovalent cation:H+ antiporter, CPA1 family